jgi:hypothetical protein
VKLQEDGAEEDAKNRYEDEAEESDINDIIDDGDDESDDEPDESDDNAKDMARSTIAALRNRRNWKESEFQCQLCADLRVVLQHLLKRK